MVSNKCTVQGTLNRKKQKYPKQNETRHWISRIKSGMLRCEKQRHEEENIKRGRLWKQDIKCLHKKSNKAWKKNLTKLCQSTYKERGDTLTTEVKVNKVHQNKSGKTVKQLGIPLRKFRTKV